MPRKKPPEIDARWKPLRARAERLARKTPADIRKMPAGEIQRLVHELQVHEIELELQNEELRGAQVLLSEARDRYFDLYEFSPAGYLTLDSRTLILECNLTAATLLGAGRRDLLGTRFSKLVAQEFRDVWHLHLQGLLSDSSKKGCDIEIAGPKTGTPVHVESMAIGEGAERRFRITLVDITKRREVEKALREMAQTLEVRVHEQTATVRLQAKAIANLGEGVLITSNKLEWPGPHILFVNEAMCRITGYSAAELIGQTPRILQGPATDRAALKRIRENLLAGLTAHAQVTNYRKDRTAYEAEIFITALVNDDGQRTNFVSIHRDVTEETRAQRALHESEQRFRLMADHAPVLVWISGTEKQCTWVNRPWLEFTGRTMEQELGQGRTASVHPEDLARCVETYEKAFDARREFRMEYRLRRHDGEWRWVLDSGSPLYRDRNEFAGYIGSCIDIHERKVAEQELEQSKKDLRAMSAELMIAEERERQRLAQYLHDAVGQALFFARRKLDEALPEEAGAILEDLSKMTATVTYELSPPVLRHLGLKPAVRWLAHEMKDRYGLSVKVDAASNRDFPVSTDAALTLFRSVRELLVNIAKHAGTTSAEIRLRRLNDRVEIEVKDHGKGFESSKAALLPRAGHFGLLSIRERLEYLGGTFAIQSAIGKGTTVLLSAPFNAATEN